jgi:hypothetical protein
MLLCYLCYLLNNYILGRLLISLNVIKILATSLICTGFLNLLFIFLNNENLGLLPNLFMIYNLATAKM